MIQPEDFGRFRKREEDDSPQFTPKPQAMPVIDTTPLTQVPPEEFQAYPAATQKVHKLGHRPVIKRALAAISLAGSLAILAIVGFVVFHKDTSANPVPAGLKTAVDYPVYYPDESKLPGGYKLNTASFANPTHDVIIYSLSNNQGQQVEVSLQDKPSANDLKAFDDYRIPLHSTFSTPIGQAIIGAIGNQNVASVPTSSKAWLILTAPQEISQASLKQLLSAFKY